jgi:hypothetical protein
LFAFYLALYRQRLIPRVLSGFGLAACLAQISAVSMPLFGHDVDFRLIAPLGIGQIVLSLWLIFMGFKQEGAK